MTAGTATAWVDDEHNAFAIVTVTEGTRLSEMLEQATEHLIELLQKPARAVLVDVEPTAGRQYRATYQAAPVVPL